MDATAGSKKAPRPAASNYHDAVPSAAQQAAAEEQSSSSPESDDATVRVAGVRASGGEDVDDEQVERFYALLDSIRAMRGMASTGTTAGRKRAREAEPPWRPAFRMEDFELQEVDSDSAGCAGEKKKKKRESRSAKRPADDEEHEEGEVVEAAKGPRREQPQSHKTRRAGVLAVDTLDRNQYTQ